MDSHHNILWFIPLLFSHPNPGLPSGLFPSPQQHFLTTTHPSCRQKCPAHGCSINSILITGSAGQYQEMSVPEIPRVVGELWTLKGVVFVTTVSLACQQLAHDSYVSSNWHFKRVYCFHLESADESSVTLWNVQNCSSATLHHTEEGLTFWHRNYFF